MPGVRKPGKRLTNLNASLTEEKPFSGPSNFLFRAASNSENPDGIIYTLHVNKYPLKKRSRWTRIKHKISKKMKPTSTKSEGGESREKWVENNGPPQDVIGHATGERRQSGIRVEPSMYDSSRRGSDCFQFHTQFTISKSKSYSNCLLQWLYYWFGIEISCFNKEKDNYLYKPSKTLDKFVNWTFYVGFTEVLFLFLGIYLLACLIFAILLKLAGDHQPDCIQVSGHNYGDDPATTFTDAFALSWTTFTTVGYGNTYPATGYDFEYAKPAQCSLIVLLCTVEAFLGLLYAAMCAAIFFGKVTRVQSDANVIFCNAVCLQFDDIESDSPLDESDYHDDSRQNVLSQLEEDVLESSDGSGSIEGGLDDSIKSADRESRDRHIFTGEPSFRRLTFKERYRGCPVLKFQVVNELANKEGGELVDAMMKVVGIKNLKSNGKIAQSQCVRVNLTDFENPFFSIVWHGVHVLDAESPLLTNKARRQILQCGGTWPSHWLNSATMRNKLDFQSLIVTVSGTSNLTAIGVHAYKRYKLADVIAGYDFAPLLFENEETGKLEIDMGLVNDVREQRAGAGVDLRSSLYKRASVNVIASTSGSRGFSGVSNSAGSSSYGE